MSAQLFARFALAAVLGAHAATAGTVLFSSDFESGLPSGLSGGSIESTADFPVPVPAFGTWFLRNSTTGPAIPTTLLLNSIPDHTSLNLSFLLAVIDSWDAPGGPGGDSFNVTVDGNPAFFSTYTNFDGSEPYGGTRLFFGPDRGYAPWADSAYAVSFSVPHTASSATVQFFAAGPDWFGGLDESWAIDNLEVQSEVPEPATVALMLGGLSTLALLRRRRALR